MMHTIYGIGQTELNMQNGRFRICKGFLMDSDEGKNKGYYDHNENYTLFLLFLLGLAALTLSPLLLAACGPATPDEAPLRWLKGNTHTHTLWSDGDAAPEQVASWSLTHGFLTSLPRGDGSTAILNTKNTTTRQKKSRYRFMSPY